MVRCACESEGGNAPKKITKEKTTMTNTKKTLSVPKVATSLRAGAKPAVAYGLAHDPQ
jgi:hypothetical protein